MFASTNPSGFEDILAGFQPRVTASMNTVLTKPVTNKEIKEAVFSIKSASAPGVDGMTDFFFKKYWDILEDIVIQEVKSFFVSGIMPKD